MAVAHRWPIRLDHCFMRVLLDNAVGTAWPRVIRRPAIRHIDAGTLDRALALGDAIQRNPALLVTLNQRSLDWRRGSTI